MSWQACVRGRRPRQNRAGRGGGVRGRRGPPQAHTEDVEGLTAFEVKFVCARLAATAPYLRELAKVVPPDQLWRVCRKECQGRDLHNGDWIIKPRWFGDRRSGNRPARQDQRSVNDRVADVRRAHHRPKLTVIIPNIYDGGADAPPHPDAQASMIIHSR